MIQPSQQQRAAADGQQKWPLDEAGDTKRAQRQCGRRRRVAAAVDALLHTGSRSGHGADDAVDCGAAHCARGRGGC